MNDSTYHNHHPAIQTFVTNMVKHSADVDTIQTIVDLDISTNAAFPLKNSSHNSFEVNITTFHKGVYYFITINNPQTSQPRWELATNYAPAVLQCFREDLGGNIQNAACFLLLNGIPFHSFAHHMDLSRGVQDTTT